MMWILLIAMFAIMYHDSSAKQKAEKKVQNFRKSLPVNQKVITAGGLMNCDKEITRQMTASAMKCFQC